MKKPKSPTLSQTLKKSEKKVKKARDKLARSLGKRVATTVKNK